MMGRGRARLFTALAFLVCLPPAFFIGIALIGHARPLPYVSVWLDRLLLAAITLGLPLLAGWAIHRLVSRRAGTGTETSLAALEAVFPGRAREARMILARYGMEAHEKEQERVQLAAVELSNGDIEELSRLIGLAKQDRRDILMWAEKKCRGANRP